MSSDASSQTDPPRARAERMPPWLRWLVVASCLLAAVAALVQAVLWDRHRDTLVELLDGAGVAAAHPETVERVRRERRSERASLLAARSLVYRVLSLHAVEATDDERARAIERLDDARALSVDVLQRLPADWEAAMLLGTATYLERSLARDRRLVTEAEAWRAPLAKAVRDGRGHPEPRRLLATAYLETWGVLSPARREEARALLGRVFDDDLRAFEALMPAWLSAAGDLDEALAIVPDRPAAWRSLEKTFAARDDWRAVAVAHGRGLDALEASLRGDLGEARARLALGEYFRSRAMLLRLVVDAPPSMRFLPLAEEALELYPPGLHGLSRTDPLGAWLDWVLELDAVSVETMSPKALGRLLDALGELEPARAAHAAIVADDLYQAERFERLSDNLRLASWAPYLTVKSRRLIARGDVDEASRALELIPAFARGGLADAVARAELARAGGGELTPSEADARLERLAARRWSPAAWRWLRRRPTLELLPSAAADGLTIALPGVPAEGAVVDVRWDGASLGLRVVRPGESLRLRLPITPEPHLLELREIAGGEVTPGEVRLLER